MKVVDARLKDYNELAYAFAMRNPRVVKLLSEPLTDETVKELLTFGIVARSMHMDDETGQEVHFNSIRELYLDYDHLKHIEHYPYSPYGEGQVIDEETKEITDDFRGNKLLYHPLNSTSFPVNESIEDAIPRIKNLIETRGGKLSRLMDGTAFKAYDAVTFFGENVYSLDPSTNTKKTIKSDIALITEWMQSDNYLKLIPQIRKLFNGG